MVNLKYQEILGGLGAKTECVLVDPRSNQLWTVTYVENKPGISLQLPSSYLTKCNLSKLGIVSVNLRDRSSDLSGRVVSTVRKNLSPQIIQMDVFRVCQGDRHHFLRV